MFNTVAKRVTTTLATIFFVVLGLTAFGKIEPALGGFFLMGAIYLVSILILLVFGNGGSLSLSELKGGRIYETLTSVDYYQGTTHWYLSLVRRGQKIFFIYSDKKLPLYFERIGEQVTGYELTKSPPTETKT